MAKLSKRYLALSKAALSHPAWGESWGGYKPATIARFLACSDARLERLALLIDRGWQGSYSMYTVVRMTDARWHQALQQLELQGGARGVQQQQRLEVRQREWVFAKHPLGADALHAALAQQAAAGQDATALEAAATFCPLHAVAGRCCGGKAAAQGQEGRRAQAGSCNQGWGEAASSRGGWQHCCRCQQPGTRQQAGAAAAGRQGGAAGGWQCRWRR